MRIKYYFVFKTTNKINDRYYIGVHATKYLNDNYLGSGKLITQAIEKYGKDNFIREILEFFPDYESALNYEKELVNEDRLLDKNCYNLCIGGGMPPIYTGEQHHSFGRKFPETSLRMIQNNPNKGKFKEKSHSYNKLAVRDKDGNTFQISKDDPRYISGEVVSVNKGKLTVRNINNPDDVIHLEKTDPRYISGEYVNSNKGTFVVIDKDGNKFRTTKDDPRYVSGELVTFGKRMIDVIDKDGKTFKVTKNDPRYLSGKLVRYKHHQKIICPICGKIGGIGAMKCWHFENCRENSK